MLRMLNILRTNKKTKNILFLHDLILGKTYENTDLNLNTDEPSRRLMERQLNAFDINSYEQIHIQSSAENMCTYDELFAIPINDTESTTLKTDGEVCFK